MRTIKTLIICGSILSLSACIHPIKIQEKNLLTPPEYYHDIPVSQRTTQDITQWWLYWQDDSLTELINIAIHDNFSYRATQKKMQEAQAYSQLATGELWPLAAIGWSKTHTNLDISTNLPTPLNNPLDTKIKMKGGFLVASWEPDIFGQKRSDRDTAIYYALSAQEAVYGAQLLLSAKVAQQYIEAAKIKQQIHILDQSIQVLQELKRYVEGRFNAGQATRADINKITAELFNIQSQQEPLQSMLKNHLQSIAILCGKIPYNLKIDIHESILDKVPHPPTGYYPSDLLQRRPDIRAKENLIYAHSAQVASAQADLLPRFYINFLFEDGKIGLNSLPKLSAIGNIFQFGVQLPIFTAGRIEANIKAKNAQLQTAIMDYNDNILQALNEVYSAYNMRFSLEKSLSTNKNAVYSYQQQVKNNNSLYHAGEITYQDVLMSKLDMLKQEENLLAIKYQRAQAAISLYQALGGGWTRENKKQENQSH